MQQTAMEEKNRARRLHAPTEHGRRLIEPSLRSTTDLLRDNAARRSDTEISFFGIPFHDLAESARRQMVRDAVDYTRSYRDVHLPERDASIAQLIVTGHQPQLFHPGVWFKSFVLDSLATQHNAIAIHVLIDNDAAHPTSLLVPGGTLDAPSMSRIPLDRSGMNAPFEDRPVLDQSIFQTLPDRVIPAIQRLVSHPLLVDMWPAAVDAQRATNNLGQSIARARHVLEQKHGLQTLELPLSQVCDTRPFQCFLLHILSKLHHFRDIYNDSIDEYRDIHGIRSRTHPVPKLVRKEQWLEAPFWMWTVDDPIRRPLFVKRGPNELWLRPGTVNGANRNGIADIRIERRNDSDSHSAIQQLCDVRGLGIKFRPRALTTTMYLRMFLSDLFVHGIGGAKYDELTDCIVTRFFGCHPPRFLTVSATFQLLPGREPATKHDVRMISSRIRDLWYHPEAHLEASPGDSDEIARLIAEKSNWIMKRSLGDDRHQRHQTIERCNARLREMVVNQRAELLKEREQLKRQIRFDSILCSREHSFCLFPEHRLVNRLSRLSQA